VGVERWTVHRLVTGAARPRGVAAAVPEARLMTNQDLVRAEGVAVGAVGGRLRHPLPAAGLHEVADHPIKRRAAREPPAVTI